MPCSVAAVGKAGQSAFCYAIVSVVRYQVAPAKHSPDDGDSLDRPWRLTWLCLKSSAALNIPSMPCILTLSFEAPGMHVRRLQHSCPPYKLAVQSCDVT